MTVSINTSVSGGYIGSSTSTNTTIVNNISNITNNSYTSTGNGVLSGGGVILTGGYGYTVSAATYSIGTVTYSSPQTNGTLATADASNPRIDIFALTTSGTAIVIQGTPASTPIAPAVDPTLYVQTGFVLVPAASAPVVTNENVYLENTEWTMTSSGSGITLNATNNPYQGTVNVRLAAVAANSYVLGTKPSGSIDPGQYNSFAIAIYPRTWAQAKSLSIQLYNGSSPIGVPIRIQNGTQGFNRTSSTYQLLVFPTSSFAAGGQAVTAIRYTVQGTGTAITADFDYTFFQAAVVQPTLSAPMVYKGVWNSLLAYSKNDVVFLQDGYSIVPYIALLDNTNASPLTAFTTWQQFAFSYAPTGTLGSGSTAITHTAHLNRFLTINQAGATGGVFAAAATSGAKDGDEFFMLNVGAGTWTASGAITAPTGYQLTATTGVLFTAVYNSTTDSFYSTTVSASGGGSGTVTSVATPNPTAAGVQLTTTNATTAASIAQSQSLGFLEIIFQSKSADYTCVLTDSGKGVDHPSTDNNARTFTIPANASVAYPLGTTLTFSNAAATATSIVVTSDTMYLGGSTTTGTRTLAQNGHCTARKIASTVWIISGAGLT